MDLTSTPASDDPVTIEHVGGKELRIGWSDGHRSAYPYRYLRINCRCAVCVHEWSRLPMLDLDKVPENLTVSEIIPRGHYALSFQFLDNHTTGIYSFELLRRICPCADCRSQKGVP